MNLDGISVFVKVVQAGSFSAAARQLGMPNTTVSAKVAKLERRLGVTLIQRTTRKLHVTPAGRAYFERCQRALAEIQAGESELENTTGEVKGLLRLTAPVDVAHGLLPPIVRRFLHRHPLAQVELVVTNRVVDLVAEGVDLAVRAGTLQDSSLIARRFAKLNGGLWASPAYLKRAGTPRHPRDLERHECIVFTQLADDKLPLTDGRESVTIPTRGRIAADDLETLRAFVRQGDGIGALPEFMGTDPAGGRLVRVLPRWRWEDGDALYFVYPSARFVSPKVQAFIAEAIRDAPGRGAPA